MKNLLSVLMILFAGAAAARCDTLFASPAPQPVPVGQSFDVGIDIDNIADLYDYQFSLAFDPTVLAAQTVTEGALFASTNDSFFFVESIDNSAGTISGVLDTLLGPGPGVTGPGTIATIQFEAIGVGTSSIDFTPAQDLILQDSSGNLLAFETQSASAMVHAASVPEPASGTLVLAVVAVGFFAARRRNSSANASRQVSAERLL